MQASEQALIKENTFALKQNSALIRKLLDINEKKHAPHWAKVTEVKKVTIWKDYEQLRHARRNKLVDWRYIKVNGVDTSSLEYNISSIHPDYLSKNLNKTADSAMIESISKQLLDLTEIIQNFLFKN